MMTPLLVALVVTLLLVALALGRRVRRLQSENRRLQGELRRRRLRRGRKRAGRKIQMRWHREITALLPDPVLVTDRHKRMLYANPAAEALFGVIHRGEAAIERLRNHKLEAQLDIALAGEAAAPSPLEFGERQLLVLARRWGHSGREEGGAILLLRDISELLRLSRARREMAANLSHELRTPLASVGLMAETLLGGALNEPELAPRLLRRIASENDAMIRLIEDLTTLSSIEHGRLPIRLEPTDLRELVEWRVQRLAPQRAQRDIQVRIDAPDAPSTMVDPERFGQVLTNLLDNAIRYSPDGGTIRICIEQDDSGTTLEITDEGPGIPTIELPRVFERFYKGDPARHRASGGTGLGLAIARHLVEAHGGTIHLDNAPRGGARARIALPRV